MRKPHSGKKGTCNIHKNNILQDFFLFTFADGNQWWFHRASHILHPTDIGASLFSRNVRNPMGCKPFSSFVSNVSSSTEESPILHPYASHKEKFWCRSLERGAEVGQFSATLTKIGFPLQKKKKERRCQLAQGYMLLLLQVFIKRLPALSCSSIIHAELYLYSSTAKTPGQKK